MPAGLIDSLERLWVQRLLLFFAILLIFAWMDLRDSLVGQALAPAIGDPLSVDQIVSDRDGALWIAGGLGYLYRYTPQLDTLITFTLTEAGHWTPPQPEWASTTMSLTLSVRAANSRAALTP